MTRKTKTESGLAPANDPLIDAIADYNAGMAAYDAQSRSDLEIIAETYGPPLTVLQNWERPAGSRTAALAALRLVESEKLADIDIALPLISAALRYFESEPAVDIVSAAAELSGHERAYYHASQLTLAMKELRPAGEWQFRIEPDFASAIVVDALQPVVDETALPENARSLARHASILRTVVETMLDRRFPTQDSSGDDLVRLTSSQADDIEFLTQEIDKQARSLAARAVKAD